MVEDSPEEMRNKLRCGDVVAAACFYVTRLATGLAWAQSSSSTLRYIHVYNNDKFHEEGENYQRVLLDDVSVRCVYCFSMFDSDMKRPCFASSIIINYHDRWPGRLNLCCKQRSSPQNLHAHLRNQASSSAQHCCRLCCELVSMSESLMSVVLHGMS